MEFVSQYPTRCDLTADFVKKLIRCEIMYWRDTQLKLNKMYINHIYISNACVLKVKVEDCQMKKKNMYINQQDTQNSCD